MLIGALASGFSSLVTTPIDVVKTRLATGMIPTGTAVSTALMSIARTEGLAGLYAGAEIRILFATIFGGVGFASYELCKVVLGVQERSPVLLSEKMKM